MPGISDMLLSGMNYPGATVDWTLKPVGRSGLKTSFRADYAATTAGNATLETAFSRGKSAAQPDIVDFQFVMPLEHVDGDGKVTYSGPFRTVAKMYLPQGAASEDYIAYLLYQRKVLGHALVASALETPEGMW